MPYINNLPRVRRQSRVAWRFVAGATIILGLILFGVPLVALAWFISLVRPPQ